MSDGIWTREYITSPYYVLQRNDTVNSTAICNGKTARHEQAYMRKVDGDIVGKVMGSFGLSDSAVLSIKEIGILILRRTQVVVLYAKNAWKC